MGYKGKLKTKTKADLKLCACICGEEAERYIMKRKIEWLQFGQYLAMWNELWAVVKNELADRNVDPGIIEYLRGPGLANLKLFIGEISVEYLQHKEKEKCKIVKASRPKPLIAEVDLDAAPTAPTAPFEGAILLVRHIGQGKARFEYRPDEDELYINGKKFVPWLSPEQSSGGVISGTDLEPKASEHGSLNATAGDFLYENPSFIPKKYCKGNLYFWASEWKDSSTGRRYIRCLDWDSNRWVRYCDWLRNGWGVSRPSASLED